MEGTATITGIKNVVAAMGAAFPNEPIKQQGLLSSAMRGSAKPTIMASAKRLALKGDGSGALSESIGIRKLSRSKVKTRRVAAGIEIVPIRYNLKAISMYSNFYYPRGTSVKRFVDGIRHGHLVEFGTKYTSARPFLWPAARSNKSAYVNLFAVTLKKRIESAVKRRAKKK